MKELSSPSRSTSKRLTVAVVIVGLLALGYGPVAGLSAPPPAPAEPKPVPYNPEKVSSVRDLTFFEAATGKPRIWYFKPSDGPYELFDNPGFHPTYGVELRPVTRDIVQELLKRAESEDSEFKYRRFTERLRAGQVRGNTPQTSQWGLPGRFAAGGDSLQGNEVIVFAGARSDASWTTEITLEELEQALTRSSEVEILLRSELREDVSEKLASTPLQDLTELRQTSRSINVRYAVIGTCLEATEQHDNLIASMPSAKFRTTVRIQMLDTQTGETIYSRVFEGWQYTQVLGGAPVGGSSGGAQGVYRKKMKAFARQFLGDLESTL